MIDAERLEAGMASAIQRARTALDVGTDDEVVDQVVVLGDVERDPDYQPGDGGSVCCTAARVVRVLERRVRLPRGAAEYLAEGASS